MNSSGNAKLENITNRDPVEDIKDTDPNNEAYFKY